MIETAGRNEYKIKEKAKNDFFFWPNSSSESIILCLEDYLKCER